MLRRRVPATLDELLMIFRIPESEEFGIVFWNLSTRLQDKKRSTYVDEIGKLSGLVVYG
jgi:hypothetical protein